MEFTARLHAKFYLARMGNSKSIWSGFICMYGIYILSYVYGAEDIQSHNGPMLIRLCSHDLIVLIQLHHLCSYILYMVRIFTIVDDL